MLKVVEAKHDNPAKKMPKMRIDQIKDII